MPHTFCAVENLNPVPFILGAGLGVDGCSAPGCGVATLEAADKSDPAALGTGLGANSNGCLILGLDTVTSPEAVETGDLGTDEVSKSCFGPGLALGLGVTTGRTLRTGLGACSKSCLGPGLGVMTKAGGACDPDFISLTLGAAADCTENADGCKGDSPDGANAASCGRACMGSGDKDTAEAGAED